MTPTEHADAFVAMLREHHPDVDHTMTDAEVLHYAAADIMLACIRCNVYLADIMGDAEHAVKFYQLRYGNVIPMEEDDPAETWRAAMSFIGRYAT